ncbi:hypothetical protein NEOLEDRAFT_1137594 [Neolentinus lepideus HHB14362 ss-1]|uniref:Uncharacterized protein n=1 Tax=Neolentinus lepideus HHB14362 ss-1 TaxID=1314782 RepID=A0A165QRM7_9AGAM|nr:hypothetical protein NEOLEDRAFT_1137594 [Neolentinus lepideus HHB14362 ss-1]
MVESTKRKGVRISTFLTYNFVLCLRGCVSATSIRTTANMLGFPDEDIPKIRGIVLQYMYINEVAGASGNSATLHPYP